MKILAHFLLVLTLVCSVGLDIADAAHDIGDIRVVVADVSGSPDVKDHQNECASELSHPLVQPQHIALIRRAPQPADTVSPPASALTPELRPPIETPLA